MEQEFVIGGYIPGARGSNALLVGVYEKKELKFVAKVKNGFVSRIWDELVLALKALQTAQCPFKNLPEKGASRWGESLTAEKIFFRADIGKPLRFFLDCHSQRRGAIRMRVTKKFISRSSSSQ